DKDEVEIHPNSFVDTLEAMPVSEGLVADGGIVGRLMVRKNDRVTLLRMRDVKWIEAAGNYIHLYELSHMYVVRGTLTYLESKLDATQFVRIHRSIIVNLEYVKELLTSPGHGEVKVFMTCGEILTMSKRYRDRFNKMFRRV